MMNTGKRSDGLPRIPEPMYGECEPGDYVCQGCHAKRFNEATQEWEKDPGCECPPAVRCGDEDLYQSSGCSDDEADYEEENDYDDGPSEP